MRNNLKPRHLGFSLLLGCLSGFVHAEQTVNDLLELSPSELADIPVSIASGTVKSVSRSAAVTSVITADQISSMGATELHEVLETVPGIHVSIQPVTNDYIYTLRGIGNETNTELLLMLNGTRFSLPRRGTLMTGMIIPVEAIQRVEVIRGPGSALYGADAFAGVINIVTKKAGDIDGTTVGARGGNADTTSAWGQHGSTWQGWDIAASLQYNHNGVDPDRVIAADLQSGFDQARSTHASLAPGPMQTQNERWNGHLNLQRKHWDVGFWAFSQGDVGLGAGAAALDKEGKLNGSNYLADAKFSTEDAIRDWEIQMHASFLYSNLEGHFTNFPPGAELPIDTNGFIDPKGFTPPNLAHFVRFPDGVRSQFRYINKVPSLQLTSIYKGIDDHLLRFITGFRYEELTTQTGRNFGPGIIDGTEDTVNGNIIDTTGTPLASLDDTHRSIWSVALQDEWRLAEDWYLTTGIRYDEYSDFGGTVNPRAALVWDINERLTSKLLYGQAYRPPSFLEQYQKNNSFFIGNSRLRPETIETTELAFDYRPVKTLRTTLNLFYYEVKDLIGLEPTSNNTALTAENTNKQNGYGSEFEWDWKFHEDWNLRGNYAWQYATNEKTSRRVAKVPEHHVYTALAWNFMPKWQIQTQLNWVGHRLSESGDTRVLADYETVDLTLNAKKLMGYLDLTASARNLFDSHGKEPATSSYPNNLPIAPQSFYFEASIHF